MTEQGLRNYSRTGVTALVVLALFLIGTIGIESVPPLWWDEGWTLCVARTWVEVGHYGCRLAGELAPPTLSGHLPVVMPVALSFHVFGIGVWQARIVGVVFTVGTLGLLYWLTSRLYNRTVAVAAMVLLLLLPAQREVYPLIVGRQVLGEMPMVFFLLAGYSCFLLTQRHTFAFLPLAICFWGIALQTKDQAWPFWGMSLIVPLIVVCMRRRWRLAGLLAGGFLGSCAMFQLLGWGKQLLLKGHTLHAPPVNGLAEVSALVLVPSVRLQVLLFTLTFGLPTAFGLAWSTYQWCRDEKLNKSDSFPDTVRLMLLVLTGSWLVWFSLLSVGWVRYAFPALFLGAPFTAVLLYDLTGGFRLASAIKTAVLAIAKRQFDTQGLKGVAALLLLCIMFVLTARAVYFFRISKGDSSAQQVAQFLNTSTPPDALIETYESELFFLLERPYHYPPAQLNVDVIKLTSHYQPISVNYNPLSANPDYLVIGRWGRWVGLYRSLLKRGIFRPIRTVGSYQVYERVH